MKKLNKTLVISAFPACGKSYIYKNNQDEFSSIDSDSSEFSWVKDENGNNTKERNPDFPNNYIKHIKENIGKVDVIFVSSHLIVREALDKESIPFITVVPEYSLKEVWKQRMIDRGNDSKFVNFIYTNWDNFLKEIRDKDKDYVSQLFIYLLIEDIPYLSNKSIHRIVEILDNTDEYHDHSEIHNRFNRLYDRLLEEL